MSEWFDDGYDPEPWGDLECDNCNDGGAKEVADPFILEVDEEEVIRKLCRGCWQQRKDDV